MKIKSTYCAGSFYPAEEKEIIDLFNSFSNGIEANYNSRMIIVPHAGYVYSGALAYKGFCYLDKNVKNIYIIAPVHYQRIYGCAICDYDEFETPLGNIKVNQQANLDFAKFCECSIINNAFEKEHSIEVQLPFIKYLLPDTQIIPILYGCENFKNLVNTIKTLYENNENAFIISSDLSHFYPEKDATKIDYYSAQMIENKNIQNFEVEQACGAVGICAAVEFAKETNQTFIRLGLTNSAHTTGDSSKVVGYGCWFLYEGEKNQYIKKHYSKFLIKTAKSSIQSGLQLGSYPLENIPCVLKENGASFVTLQINQNLRGCIGSIIAHRPLIDDIYKNSHSAAFNDPRFLPLSLEEFQDVKINISLLNSPQRIDFKNENELLEKITPYKDGVIIKDGNYQAVFLPIVWEQLPQKRQFLDALKNKAGMPANYNSKTMEAFIFQTTYIQE